MTSRDLPCLKSALRWAREAITEGDKEAMIQNVQDEITRIAHKMKPDDPPNGHVQRLCSLREYLKTMENEEIRILGILSFVPRLKRTWRFVYQAMRNIFAR